jgi:hypothetical protein
MEIKGMSDDFSRLMKLYRVAEQVNTAPDIRERIFTGLELLFIVKHLKTLTITAN